MKARLMLKIEELDQYPQNGSGWQLYAILGSDLEMDKFKLLRGSSLYDTTKTNHGYKSNN